MLFDHVMNKSVILRQTGYVPHIVPTVGKGSEAGCEDLEELEENRDFWLVCVQSVLLQ